MAARGKRRHEEVFDPNASDPEDLDYGADSPRPTRRSRPSKGHSQRKPGKRPRQRYSDSEGDVVDDGDEGSEESYASDSQAEDEDEENIELNPRTGRRVRSAAKKNVKYEESDAEDVAGLGEEDDDDDDDDNNKGRARREARPRRSLIVKLPLAGHASRDMDRPRRGSRTIRRGATPDVGGQRRSSRISHDREEPLVALTDSGHHEVVAREGSREPELAVGTRLTRGGKGVPKKHPSAIMEASQEDSTGARTQDQDEAAEEGKDNEAEAAQAIKYSPVPDADAEGEEEEANEVIQESQNEEDEDSDDGPVRAGRSLRSRKTGPEPDNSQKRKRGIDESSDFDPTGEGEAEDDDNMHSSDDEGQKQSVKDSTDESTAAGRRSQRLRGRGSQRSRQPSGEPELDPDELAEEAEMLEMENSKRRRSRRAHHLNIAYDDQPKLRNRSQRPDYRIFRPELVQTLDEEDNAAAAATPSRNRKGGAWVHRSLFSTLGPFGGAGPSLAGGPSAAGGADSDSSDDDGQARPRNFGLGGTVGMTPTSAAAPSLFPQTHNADPAQAGGSGGGPAGLGKVKDKKALADADPLGVDQNVNFDGVGGLDDHINQLKEMVALPLLYPEIFQQFHITPPRGVLFHGPPGTGKTLLARALASSVSAHGKKVTFYMRKGADALSKWVGEAERQLRLLFEEARKNQPSIIFFDEIDGLAPVRSSKQEQIHASIVATLLALMDGMDGRGQVIIIGATNRPDNVDPALRRPGRFDREFYFPLPSKEARKAIINIHTKDWSPPLQERFKDQLAELTKGYGGADLRALCTEAALNAVQGTFPQIYKSDKKLLIDPTQIQVLAKDFMLSVNKIIPSSERSASSAAAPLGKSIEPLLRKSLADIGRILDEILPQRTHMTALEEAQYDDRDDELGFEKETIQRDFERSKIFRPRLLIRGLQGMGQQYVGAALLHRFERLHVQSFDLATILEDSSRAPEAAIIQLFKEVRRHKPSVIYIPNADVWYQTIAPTVIKTFTSLLRTLPPNDPVLVLGVLESSSEKDPVDPALLRDLFGFSLKNQYQLNRPDKQQRREFFEAVAEYIRKAPTDFPDQVRKKRDIPELEVAPEIEAPKGPTKDQMKAQKKQDRHTLNLLKILIQPVMDQIKNKYKKFRVPIVDDRLIGYLYDEQDPERLATDLDPQEAERMEQQRPYQFSKDAKGVPGLLEVATGRFYYNLEIVMIEKRLSNGYYKRTKDFLADIKRLAKDAKTSGDEERTIKANEMLSNVEVDMQMIEAQNPALIVECEAVYLREEHREKEAIKKAEEARRAGEQNVPEIRAIVLPHVSGTTAETSGPILLGEQVPGPATVPPVTPIRQFPPGSLSNGVYDSSHRISNGSTVPSRPDEDVHMHDSQDVFHDDVFQKPSQGGLQSQQRTHTQGSRQSGALTQMAHNSVPADYHNSASTTTSGQKTSDRSNHSSGHNNTQSTNGVTGGQYPDFSAMALATGGSQLPDTQENTFASSQQSNSQPSQSSQQQQQAFTVPTLPRQPPGMPDILNATSTPIGQATATASRSQAQLVLDVKQVNTLHDELVLRSSGLSVEQLEQVNATLMDAIWKSRSEWNRNKVIEKVTAAFNETIKDIEAMQAILPPSQPEYLYDGTVVHAPEQSRSRG